jgi:hypothetical protein
MASEFKRLYKELHAQSIAISRNVYDPTFEREREEMLFILGHDVPSRPAEKEGRIRGPKYHGQVVRALMKENTYNAPKESQRMHDRVDRKKKISTVRLEAEELSKITDEMKYLIEKNQPIPNNLIKRLKKFETPAAGKKLTKKTQSAGSSSRMLLPPIETKSASSSPSKKLSNIPSPPFKDIREVNQRNRSYTENKWSADEREKISYIFHDMRGPSNKQNKELWNLYFIAFSDRFRLFYPYRKETEIIDKVREMIDLRMMKSGKEIQYWATGGHLYK